MADDAMSSTYAKRVGERLRAIRLQKGFSLHDVEDVSGKEFKASVLGAYERGERSISVPRLQRLAQFYGVPVDQLLPKLEGETIVLDGRGPHDGGIRLDLAKLREASGAETDAISRFATMIQMARGDFNGRVLTVRTEDLRALAAALDLTTDALKERLDDLGVRIPALV
ncbi:MAG TPA: helix-turn-helix domain-containing protein [Actinomycetota bacterium]